MPIQKFVNNAKKTTQTCNIMEPTGGLVTNNSHQELMSDCDSVDLPSGQCQKDVKKSDSYGFNNVTKMEWVSVFILCFVNLINYMDRFTVAGVLPYIQAYFQIGDARGGLLQTAFVLSYMIFAPLFGYLGDRYSRRLIMAFGVFLWSITTLIGSFMETFEGFMLFRALVGIGEASYSTIAPTIISDMFVKDVRSKMLALFYFAIPVGSGLGYIVGSETANIAGSWQWGLRVTPILGGIAVIAILGFLSEPERGAAEGNTHLRQTSWWEDIKDLVTNPSFMLSTAGFTCVAFVAGALSWWGPTFVHIGMKMKPGNENLTINEVSFSFGVVTMMAGLIGVPLGSYLGSALKTRFPRIDAIICAVGLFLSAPLLIFAMMTVRYLPIICLVLIFFGQLMLNLNWAIVADILLYVVIPTRRSTAEAFQILISHALGDAGSPYLIGVISEALKSGNITHNPNEISPSDSESSFKSLQYALFFTSFVEILGGIFFLVTAIFIVRDKLKVDRITNGDLVPQPRHLFAEDVSDSEQRHNLVS